MSRDIRTVLVVGVVALAIGAVVAGAGVAFAGPDEDGSNGGAPGDGAPGETITVTASGDAEAAPDRAEIRLAVEARSEDPDEARREVAENAQSMRDALAEIGLDDEVRSEDFRIHEDRMPPREHDGEPERVYRAYHTFVVELDDTERAGEVIDVAVENGATSVHDVRFTLSEETERELKQQALEDAMGNARSQADAIAGSAELSIAGVHSVETGAPDHPRPYALEAAADADGAPTEIESGPVEVTATVKVVYDASG